MENVGTAIRQMRQRQGWTLKKLSSLTGLSVSFLSQAERGQSSLSIVSLTNICRALGVDPSQLLAAPKDARAPDESSFPVIAEENQLCIRIASSPVSYRYLSGGFPGRVIEVLVNEFPAAYHHPLAAHPGEEFGYVLEGDLTLRIGEESYPLSPGDCYHFAASRPHGYETSRKGGARVLMATTQKFLEWHTGARPAKGLA